MGVFSVYGTIDIRHRMYIGFVTCGVKRHLIMSVEIFLGGAQISLSRETSFKIGVKYVNRLLQIDNNTQSNLIFK